jgi:hypothetical protein
MVLLWVALAFSWHGVSHSCFPDEECHESFETDVGQFTYESSRGFCRTGTCFVERIRDSDGEVRCATVTFKDGSGFGRQSCKDWPRKLVRVKAVESSSLRAKSAIHSLLQRNADSCWKPSAETNRQSAFLSFVVDNKGRIVRITASGADEPAACIIHSLTGTRLRDIDAAALVTANVRFTWEDER